MLLLDTISTIFGGDYCAKLKPISGTHDQLQVQGVVSAQAYPSQKMKLISLNRRVLKPNKLHQTVERELKDSLINIRNEESSGHKQQGAGSTKLMQH